MLETVIFLANAAARRASMDGGTGSDSMAAVYKAMTSCLTIIHTQLDKHRAPASATQLQVSTGSRTAFAS